MSDETESAPEYGYYEIVYSDLHDCREPRVRETMSMVTEAEAIRCAAGWQHMSWVYGRKYSHRIMNIAAVTAFEVAIKKEFA